MSKSVLAAHLRLSVVKQPTLSAVIARSGSDEAIQSGIARLDCFASLAMTK
jgi:hypothetical protein